MDNRLEALARVIDPESWELYDDPRMDGKTVAQDSLAKPSLTIASRIIASGLMAAYEWDRKEFITARNRLIESTSRSGRCESHEDGLDGYFKHDPRCIHWPDGAVGGSNCVS